MMNGERNRTLNRKAPWTALGMCAVAGMLAVSIGLLMNDGRPASSGAVEPSRAEAPGLVPVDRAIEVPAELSGGAGAVVAPSAGKGDGAKPQAAVAWGAEGEGCRAGPG